MTLFLIFVTTSEHNKVWFHGKFLFFLTTYTKNAIFFVATLTLQVWQVMCRHLGNLCDSIYQFSKSEKHHQNICKWDLVLFPSSHRMQWCKRFQKRRSYGGDKSFFSIKIHGPHFIWTTHHRCSPDSDKSRAPTQRDPSRVIFVHVERTCRLVSRDSVAP